MTSNNDYIYDIASVSQDINSKYNISNNAILRTIPSKHILIQDSTQYLRNLLEDSPDLREYLPIPLKETQVTIDDVNNNSYMIFEEHQVVDKVSHKELYQVIADSITLLQLLQSNNIVHNGIHTLHLCKQERYGFIWNQLLTPRSVLLSSKLYSESPILSPLQIILEILASKHEDNLIEVNYFKTRVQEFWSHLLRTQCNDIEIQSIALSYYISGSESFYDYFIRRYCIFDKSNMFIVKETKKALGYLDDIDMFSLGITIHYLTTKSKIPITNKIKSIIFKLIQGEMHLIINPNHNVQK